MEEDIKKEPDEKEVKLEEKEEEKHKEHMENGGDEMEECPKCREYNKDKKIKNLLSIAILLAGLFVGSLFVDVAQVVKGGGFSQKNLGKSNVFVAGGKTWVAYTEPPVPVSVVSDDTCVKCDPSEALVWLQRVLPTVSPQKVDFASDEGKKLISEFGIKTLPAFVFDKNLDKTNFYTQAQVLFTLKDNQYVLDTNQLGLPAGKYLATPTVDDGDATLGKADSNVKVVIYSDFQCPYCKVFYSALRDAMKNYQDKVFFDFKEFPLDIHPQSNDAALAGECALDQGKFWEYADKLYAVQSEWGNASDITFFKGYARTIGLDSTKFNQCLDSKTHQDKIDANKKEATDLGLSGTPSIFVNSTFEEGAVTADQLKADIDAELSK